MSSSSIYGNVLNAVPAAQVSKNTVARINPPENTSEDFQQTLQDIQAAQVRLKKQNAEKINAAHKRITVAKNSNNTQQHEVQNSNTKPTAKREPTDKLVAQADSSQDKTTNIKNDVADEKKQETLDQPSVLQSEIKPNNAIVDSVAAMNENNILGSEVAGGIQKLTGLENSPQLESITADDSSVINKPLPSISTGKNPLTSATKFTVESNTVLATLENGCEKPSVSSDENILTASKVDTANKNIISAEAETVLQTTDPKNIFEKMLQLATVKGVGGNTDDKILTGNTNSAVTPSIPPTSLTSALDSYSRADSLVPAGRSFVVQAAVPTSVGQPQWSEAVGEKVLWLASQNVNAAEIRLDPPELGPLQVKVSLNQDQTSVTFTSHHAGVRELLDQSLPRLRDMFQEQGLNLVNVDVSDRAFQRQQGEGKEQRAQPGTTDVTEEETVTSVSTIVQKYLVDNYV